MKKLFVSLIFTVVLIGIFHMQDRHDRGKFEHEEVGRQWTTHQKEQQKVSTSKTTKEQMEKHRLVAPPKRKPASVPKVKKKKRAVKVARKVLQSEHFPYTGDIDDLPMLNVIDPRWKEQLAERLLRFHDEEAKVFIKNLRGAIRIEQEGGRFVQKVLVTFTKEGGFSSSFNAWVDGQSGMILKTWNNTHYDDPLRQRIRLRNPGSFRDNLEE